MASDRRLEERRKNKMDQNKYDDECLRSVQEGLERLLEELLREEEQARE